MKARVESIVAECEQCKSQTLFVVSLPKLPLLWRFSVQNCDLTQLRISSEESKYFHLDIQQTHEKV